MLPSGPVLQASGLQPRSLLHPGAASLRTQPLHPAAARLDNMTGLYISIDHQLIGLLLLLLF